MFLRWESSCDLNPTTEQEDSIQIVFGNLLNILIDHDPSKAIVVQGAQSTSTRMTF